MLKKYCIHLCLAFISCSASNNQSASTTHIPSAPAAISQNSPISFFSVITSFIEDIRSEANDEKRARLCNSLLRLIDLHERKNDDCALFSLKLKELRDELATTNQFLDQRKENSDGLVLPQCMDNQTIYRGVFNGRGMYFREILKHLESEFFNRGWGRPVLEGIRAGTWYKRVINISEMLNESSIAVHWMLFLEEMKEEVNRVENLIRMKLNENTGTAPQNEIDESNDLFKKISCLRNFFTYLHYQAADKKIGEGHRKVYTAIMNTPEDSEIISAYREAHLAEMRQLKRSFVQG